MKPKGALICFTGIDGSGKTTQAKLLLDWLTSKGIRSTYIWSRGEVLTIRSIFLFFGRKALGTSARKIANDKKSYSEYQSRKSKLMENPLVRMLWSAMTRFEHILQINLGIRRKLGEGGVVVCDRYLWDSTIDMAVLNKKGTAWLTGWQNKVLWKLVPRPTLTFFIDIPPQEAMRRKDDIPSLEYVSRRAELYQYLASVDSFTVIDGCEEPAAIQNKIIEKVESIVERQGKA